MSKQKLILVHGTFAADGTDAEEAWWSQSGVFGRMVKGTYEGGAGPSLREHFDEVVPFTWSGENTVSARRAASAKLLAKCVELEKQGCPYSLIGHSHGGTVIWGALRAAAWNRQIKLEHLKSWVTVGTPFIHLKRTLRVRLASLVWRCLLIVDLCALAILLTSPEWVAEATGLRAVAEAPVLLILGIGLLWSFARWRRLAPDPGSRLSRREDEEILLLYLPRWFGVWAKNDEAIAALKSATRLRSAIVPRATWTAQGRDPAELLDAVFRLPTAILQNGVIAPALDHFLKRALRSAALGLDDHGLAAPEVDRWPKVVSSDAGAELPHLPVTVEERLVSAANRVLGESGTAARRALADLALGIDVRTAFSPEVLELDARALVHTSYFDEPLVLEFICRRLADDATTPANHPALSQEYLHAFRSGIEGFCRVHSGGRPIPWRWR